MSKLKQGFVQIYTGNGKGKSTASIGQAVRAAGFGLKTYIAQFMKEYPYNELISLKHLSEWITIEQFGGDEFVYKKQLPGEEELDKAKRGLESAKEKMLSGEFDLIILDEAIVAIYFKLIETKDLVEFIKSKPENVELILTGRYCPEELIELADLVTEMKEVKHYYQKGITSRKGIES
ncbi:MAG TPA: cob(I)yrinic acid a,c-diamide adenosyltransferase [Ignavibacteriaceae bacterium]|nr:cob(I)yrinic acid a,c-diamide adenosyltransferase [Ignavibacteriaceae bacterium]